MRLDINNNEYFEVFILPAGEPHIKWKKSFEPKYGMTHVTLLARVQNGVDLMKLLVATDALRRTGNVWGMSLTIPYFPGARQDRAKYGEPLTAKVYADVINAQGYEMVNVIDPHSDVTPALINNVNILPVQDILRKIVTDYEYDTIIIPDAGATKRMFSYYFPDLEFNKRLNFVQCLKKRDTETGKLSGFRIVDEISPLGRLARCLIVDDICDGGGTFIGLAEELSKREYGVEKYKIANLGLYTTHGIYSKGINQLYHTFDNLFCTDSFARPNMYDVVVYPFEK